MFAEILLPQKVGTDKDSLTYKIPLELEQIVKKGNIVEVPLRKSKLRGVVIDLHQNTPSYNTKDILGIVEKAPHLQEWQIELLTWISNYYFCPLFKALKLFLPATINTKKKILDWMPEEEQKAGSTRLTLSPEQMKGLESIDQSEKKIILIHGITGSGKTEVYRRLAEAQLKKGKQTLILVPEISLTPQTFQTFQEEFGNHIAVLHSQITAKQKEHFWYDIYHGQTKIIIGSRSALFAPFKNLGEIIIDEEHETSYKQDQSPRYHARDVATKLTELLNIKLILGSATPSLETYFQAKEGNFGLVELQNRVSNLHKSELPNVQIVDLREELRNKNYSIFSAALNKKLVQKLSANEQAILFINRRGAASAILCRECGYIEKCENCDVSMTYHKTLSVENLTMPAERLICHHCGLIKKVPIICPKCGSSFIRYLGLGTQKVQDEVLKIFPKARVLRADKDTIQKRDSFKQLYEDFKSHKADLLIGTQMIAKGLHFPNVNLVGIILAELSLTMPDFRSTERTFQLLTQVAGRAGRDGTTGEVVIQTYIPDNYAIQKAQKHDFHGFYEEEIQIRKNFHYPPFAKLIKITFSNTKHEKCHQETKKMFDGLQKDIQLAENIDLEISSVTMYPAFLARLNKKFRWNILITGKNPSQFLKNYLSKNPIQRENIKIDVDPISTL